MQCLIWLCMKYNLNYFIGASQLARVVKNPPANTGDIKDTGSIPGLRSSPRGGNGSPLQYSCLKNLMDRSAWLATVHRVKKSQRRLKQLSACTQTHTHTHTHTRTNMHAHTYKYSFKAA